MGARSGARCLLVALRPKREPWHLTPGLDPRPISSTKVQRDESGMKRATQLLRRNHMRYEVLSTRHIERSVSRVLRTHVPYLSMKVNGRETNYPRYLGTHSPTIKAPAENDMTHDGLSDIACGPNRSCDRRRNVVGRQERVGQSERRGETCKLQAAPASTSRP